MYDLIDLGGARPAGLRVLPEDLTRAVTASPPTLTAAGAPATLADRMRSGIVGTFGTN